VDLKGPSGKQIQPLCDVSLKHTVY